MDMSQTLCTLLLRDRRPNNKRLSRISLSSWLILLAWWVAGCAAPVDAPAIAQRQPHSEAPLPLTVAAASDLQNAFTEIADRFEERTGQPVTLVFGSTGQLAQQIENGAPFDLFAAANISFIEDLRDQNLVLAESVALYAEGRIVLATNRLAGVEANTLADLLDPAIRQVAIANPEHAPYGTAAMEALVSTGLWEALQPKLIYGENVRQALQFIQTGDAQAGIVALSIADAPEITWTLLDAELHRPLRQALAVVATSTQPQAAQEFAAFITGEEGRLIMQRFGFLAPGEE
jgi:molybdate transport system substrate-binding protein